MSIVFKQYTLLIFQIIQITLSYVCVFVKYVNKQKMIVVVHNWHQNRVYVRFSYFILMINLYNTFNCNL